MIKTYAQKFRLADGRRELISEKNFTYIKKSTSGTVEVIVILFTDLILIVRLKRSDSFVLVKNPLPYESIVFLDKPDSDGAWTITCRQKIISNYPSSTRNPPAAGSNRI